VKNAVSHAIVEESLMIISGKYMEYKIGLIAILANYLKAILLGNLIALELIRYCFLT
jgi:hypothetical protein